MKRLPRDEAPGASSRLAEQDGFTLIELLVTMVISLIVLGGGIYGLALAFNHSNDVSARSASNSQAEVGLQQLTNDLRFVTACPTYNGTNTFISSTVSISGILTSSGPTLQMCDPVAGSHTVQPPPLALVTWTCTLGAGTESCTRRSTSILCGTVAATGPCTTAPTLSNSPLGSTVIHGVTSLSISGIVSGANQSSLLSDSTCQVASGYESYGLTTGATCPLSWVGLQAQVVNLVDPGSPGDSNNTGVASRTAPVQIQTGVALRNYGA